MSICGWRIALVLWMVLIFLGSSGYLAFWMSADGTVEVLGSFNYWGRKSAHIGEFAVLTYLWVRSLLTQAERLNVCLHLSMGLSILYAVSDEVHQSFVPQRQGIWYDVLFDAGGVLLAGLLLRVVGAHGPPGLRQRVLGSLEEKVVVDDGKK